MASKIRDIDVWVWNAMPSSERALEVDKKIAALAEGGVPVWIEDPGEEKAREEREWAAKILFSVQDGKVIRKDSRDEPLSPETVDCASSMESLDEDIPTVGRKRRRGGFFDAEWVPQYQRRKRGISLTPIAVAELVNHHYMTSRDKFNRLIERNSFFSGCTEEYLVMRADDLCEKRKGPTIRRLEKALESSKSAQEKRIFNRAIRKLRRGC